MTHAKPQSAEPLLPVLVGATASGKTALSLALAERLNGEIVSCDSVAVYREMEIGTAKPTLAERARIPHHMIDVVTPAQPYTAGDYGRAARAAINNIASRGLTPIVAGGTGLYLRALLDGLSPIPQRDESLRDRLRAYAQRHGTPRLHRLLTRLDPAAARAIHANDLPKLIRAIEVCTLERRPISQSWSQQQPQPLTGYRIVMLGLAPPRPLLYQRINQRAAAMFHNGLIQETHALIAKYGAECRAFTSLGYAQAVAVIEGKLSLAEAIAAAQQGHRNYAKRQGTWFRKDTRIHWLPGFGEDQLKASLDALDVH